MGSQLLEATKGAVLLGLVCPVALLPSSVKGRLLDPEETAAGTSARIDPRSRLLPLSFPPPACACTVTGAGYTGSYIFSQTLFSMRAGVVSWAHGACIAALELAVFLLPFSGEHGRGRGPCRPGSLLQFQLLA